MLIMEPMVEMMELIPFVITAHVTKQKKTGKNSEFETLSILWSLGSSI